MSTISSGESAAEDFGLAMWCSSVVGCLSIDNRIHALFAGKAKRICAGIPEIF
jgi:hypothetical protein